MRDEFWTPNPVDRGPVDSFDQADINWTAQLGSADPLDTRRIRMEAATEIDWAARLDDEWREATRDDRTPAERMVHATLAQVAATMVQTHVLTYAEDRR